MMAQSFGWHAHLCDRSEDLEATLRTALDEKGPSLVVIPVDYRENTLLSQRLGEMTQTNG